MIKVLKKDRTLQDFDFQKIVTAVEKSASRIGREITPYMIKELEKEIIPLIHKQNTTVERIHQVVEMGLSKIDIPIADSYRSYRNWKKEMAEMMNTVVVGFNKTLDERDRSNSNLNSMLFSAKRTNASKILLAEMYKKYFLKKEESQALNDGFIYVHDLDNRLIGTHNCCVIKAEDILDGGFEINGYYCKEPKDIVNAIGVLGDIIVTNASAQYGGFTCAEVDTTLAKYCEKSEKLWYKKFRDMGLEDKKALELAIKQTSEDLENALQALEFQLNTRESSRGDFPFTTFSFGKDTSFWGREVSKTILSVRRKGHGDKIKQKVIFPKLVFIIRQDGQNDDILDDAIYTSSKCLYPDYIRDDVASPMGCRSFLSDCLLEDGTNLLWGRGNIGVVSLNLPLIYQNAKVNSLDFWKELEKYVDMIRDIHFRTYDYIGKQKAGSNPLMFCEGGFYGGHLDKNDIIAPIIKKYFTASFGTTALNELCILHNGKSIVEDSSFADEVINFMQNRIDYWKEKDKYSYSIYGTPAESLAGKQVLQFRKKFGFMKGISDRDYFTNSFHCHVSEEINPFEKQDNEVELFHKHTGGHIQYVRITNPSNLEAIKQIVKRGVLHYNLYQGVNVNSSTCHSCGHQWSDGESGELCPKCGGSDVIEFNRICGYLGMTRKRGDWTLNESKLSEIKDRKSM